jgi:hypothetical protein
VAAAPGGTADAGRPDLRTVTRKVLANPVMGFAPWIVFSVIEGPGRFDLAALAALGLSVAILVVGLAVGVRGKLLDLAAIAFFAVLLVLGVVGDRSVHAWLERWAGEISNVMIALVALGSVAVRRPFTSQYAREQTDPEYWDTPVFVHINYVLTWVWIGAFFVTAVVGWYGDGPLHQPDNVWTNWIVSIALLIFAIRFTEWYPDVARAHALQAAGLPVDEAPESVGRLFVPLAAYLVPLGVVILVFGAAPTWSGIVLIVLGAGLVRALGRGTPSRPSPVDPLGQRPGSAAA